MLLGPLLLGFLLDIDVTVAVCKLVLQRDRPAQRGRVSLAGGCGRLVAAEEALFLLQLGRRLSRQIVRGAGPGLFDRALVEVGGGIVVTVEGGLVLLVSFGGAD